MLASVGETWVKFRNMLPLGRAPVPGCSPISTTCGLEWTKHGHWVRFDQVWAEFVRNWTEFYRRRGSVGRTWPDAAVHRPISSRIPPPGRRSDGHLGTLIEQRAALFDTSPRLLLRLRRLAAMCRAPAQACRVAACGVLVLVDRLRAVPPPNALREHPGQRDIAGMLRSRG